MPGQPEGEDKMIEKAVIQLGHYTVYFLGLIFIRNKYLIINLGSPLASFNLMWLNFWLSVTGISIKFLIKIPLSFGNLNDNKVTLQEH